MHVKRWLCGDWSMLRSQYWQPAYWCAFISPFCRPCWGLSSMAAKVLSHLLPQHNLEERPSLVLNEALCCISVMHMLSEPCFRLYMAMRGGDTRSRNFRARRRRQVAAGGRTELPRLTGGMNTPNFPSTSLKSSAIEKYKSSSHSQKHRQKHP